MKNKRSARPESSAALLLNQYREPAATLYGPAGAARAAHSLLTDAGHLAIGQTAEGSHGLIELVECCKCDRSGRVEGRGLEPGFRLVGKIASERCDTDVNRRPWPGVAAGEG